MNGPLSHAMRRIADWLKRESLPMTCPGTKRDLSDAHRPEIGSDGRCRLCGWRPTPRRGVC